MARIAIALVVLLVAVTLLVAGMSGHFAEKWPELALNLGTELIGIVVTVLIVDWLMERRRTADEARRIALTALHDVDHAIWVWQGGARKFDLAELSKLLGQVKNDDPLPEFTQNLLLIIGSRAANSLRTRRDETGISSDLRDGLTELSKISAMRDGASHLSPRDVAKYSANAIRLLARAGGVGALLETASLSESTSLRSTKIEDQEWRHFGRRPREVQHVGGTGSGQADASPTPP